MTTLTVLKAQPIERRKRKDLKTLALFVGIYCRGRHPDRARQPMTKQDLPPHFPAARAGIDHLPGVCPECRKLLLHALVKRLACPMVPKPMCKHCPRQCYAPAYRQRIRQVMKYAGRRLVLGGRLDYLYHLLF